jgi:hypothetical protein
MKKNIKKWSDLDIRQYLEDNVKHCDISYRGGSLRINAEGLFPRIVDLTDEEIVVGAYQNYLGGGIAGKICGGWLFDTDLLTSGEKVLFDRVMEQVKKYFFDLNNGGGDDYMQENYSSFEHNQKLPASAY